MKIFNLCVLAVLYPVISWAQITGKVTNHNNFPLPGAHVYWAGTAHGVSADSTGNFSIVQHQNDGELLVASYVGFKPDTVKVVAGKAVIFSLQPGKEITAVEIQGRQTGVRIDNDNAVKIETITQTELEKAACCDLAGCFETQTTVQPQTTDVLTNAKELRISGLSGVYNQILYDGMPMIQGLTYTYGITAVPGTMVNNIYVSKGANSVLQGYESISGQINVDTKDPDEGEKLLLNAYLNNFGESQYNANYSMVKKDISNLTSAHVVQPARVTDNQGDGFMDLPRLTRYKIMNKTKYRNETDLGFHSELMFSYMDEKRIGGETGFDYETDRGTENAYGQTSHIQQPEFWSKSGYKFNANHHTDLFISAFGQNREAYFGALRYNARQENVHLRLQHEYSYGTNHNLKAGASYRYMQLNENIEINDTRTQRDYGGDYLRKDNIPGVFAENSFSFLDEKLIWTAGIRADHHQIHGTRFTPRTFVKYDIRPGTIIRANAGTGWRLANVFSENIGLMASSRNVIFREELQPEEAVNYGVSLTHKFSTDNLSGLITLDYYETRFQNQIFPDFDADPTRAILYNHRDKSISRSYQAELMLTFYERVEWKTGYVFLDVFREVEGEKRLLPFNARHRVMSALSYRPLNDKFHIDFNWHLFGKKRLPDTRQNPEEYQRPDFSRVFSTLSGQFTYNFGKFEVYAGCENIFNYRQRFPILGYGDPFGEYFDTSFIWGPVRGREIYGGLRFKI